EENAAGRLVDMDLEGRDLDFMFPGTWAASLTALDVTLAEGLYRAYHRYMHDYTAIAPARLKSAAQVPGGDVAWAVEEIETLAQEPWLAAVWGGGVCVDVGTGAGVGGGVGPSARGQPDRSSRFRAALGHDERARPAA